MKENIIKASKLGVFKFNKHMSSRKAINIATSLSIVCSGVNIVSSLFVEGNGNISIEEIQSINQSVADNTEAVRQQTEAIKEQIRIQKEILESLKKQDQKSWFQKIIENIQIGVEFNNEVDLNDNNTVENGRTVGKNENIKCIQGDNPERRMR